MLVLNNLTGFHSGGGAGGGIKETFLAIMTRLGLEPNLTLLIDMGDSASYPGTGQSLIDLSSSTNNLVRGISGGAGADDPTFEGVAGGLSGNDFLSFDGGDIFRSTVKLSWQHQFHKNNALYSFGMLFYLPSGLPAIDTDLFSTTGGGTTFNGVSFNIVGGGGSPIFSVYKVWGGFTNFLTVVSVDAIEEDKWNFVGLSINEAEERGSINVNSNAFDFDSTYSSPNSGNSTGTLGFAGAGKGLPWPDGMRFIGTFFSTDEYTDNQFDNLNGNFLNRPV